MHGNKKIFRHRRHALFALLVWVTVASTGCARLSNLQSAEAVPGLSPWNTDIYAQYVKQNIEELNRRYSAQYEPVEFVVDTDGGSARVQVLIDPAATALLAEVIGEPASDNGGKIDAVMQVIRQRFEYIPEPATWAPVRETIRAGKGDCKNLSILLMSVLTASGIEAYAGVSNGHMWVQAYDGQQWHTLETDKDPVRNQVYRIPGFYDHPLFKIYADQSLKRIPR